MLEDMATWRVLRVPELFPILDEGQATASFKMCKSPNPNIKKRLVGMKEAASGALQVATNLVCRASSSAPSPNISAGANCIITCTMPNQKKNLHCQNQTT